MTTIAAAQVRAPGSTTIKPMPLTRITGVELRKMFDTRSGFWLIASIAITSALAAGGVILWATDAELTYSTFATAIRFPVVIILPLIAILAVTS
ncbi:MAG: transporter permease, partial [Nocardioides sp.]|nr:transporter permease [Nocardioides sp.]